MASQPPVNEAFLREVDDELRRDEIVGFWKNYGKALVGGVIGVLALWAGWLWWQNRQLQASGADGDELALAVKALEAGDTAGAEKKMKLLKDSKIPGYRGSARLGLAALLLQKGDTKGAASAYGEIAADTALAKPVRDLALIRQTAAEFDSMQPQAVIARLQPLAAAGNPWFGSAGEMSALSYIKMGKPELAAKIFAELAKDENVPETIRSRAVQMAGVLGIDAVPAAKEIAK